MPEAPQTVLYQPASRFISRIGRDVQILLLRQAAAIAAEGAAPGDEVEITIDHIRKSVSKSFSDDFLGKLGRLGDGRG